MLALCLAAMLPVRAADTDAQNRAYQASLPLYQYDSAKPLAVKMGAATAFPDCRLLRLSYASTNKQRVPALLFLPPSASKTHPVPCLVLLHGLGGKKEMMVGFARYAATQGYASLAIDEYGQGARKPPGAKGLLTPQAIQQQLVTGVTQTVVDVRRGMDYLQARPGIDRKRLGLIGVSLGAIIGSVASGVDSRVKATVLVSGGGDWALILQSLSAKTRTVGGQQITQAQNVDWTMVRALLSPEDPLTFAPHIAPRALLMENGRKDTTIIPQAAEELYQAAQSAPGSHVQIDWYPNAGHVPDASLLYPAVQKWLAHNL